MRVVQRFSTAAAPDRIWRLLADVEHWPDWTPTVTEIKPLGATGLRVGARYRVLQPNLRPAIYEVTQCVPGENFTWAQKFPGGALIAEHIIRPVKGGRTEVARTAVELSFASKGILADIVAAIFSSTIRDYVATEARSLKNRCDALSAARLNS
jgi:hypothetical protein